MDMLGLKNKSKTPFGKLSGGQKQRLSIALALLGSPRVAVLDELTTGLDPQARRDTWELIEGVRDRGVTIVLVTHEPDVARYVRRRVEVRDGRIMRDEAIIERRRAADDLALMPTEGSS